MEKGCRKKWDQLLEEQGAAEEGTGEPMHREVWGEPGSWCLALPRWVCPVPLRPFVFTWEITGENGNSAVVLMWDTFIRE